MIIRGYLENLNSKQDEIGLEKNPGISVLHSFHPTLLYDEKAASPTLPVDLLSDQRFLLAIASFHILQVADPFFSSTKFKSLTMQIIENATAVPSIAGRGSVSYVTGISLTAALAGFHFWIRYSSDLRRQSSHQGALAYDTLVPWILHHVHGTVGNSSWRFIWWRTNAEIRA
jgi:hypothetical protein